MLKTKYKYIHFVKIKNKETPYFIFSNRSFFYLGAVQYYRPWKCYVVEFESDRVFNNDCLRDIADFLDQMNEKLKENKNGKKSITPSE